MKIASVNVWNYRILKGFCVYLEDDLSVVIGKNNTGKTSLLSALSKFLSSGDSRKLLFDDINIEERERILDVLKGSGPIESHAVVSSVGMRLYIEYTEEDDLSTASKLITNLDPDDRNIILEFSYELIGSHLYELRNRWNESGQKDDISAKAFLRQNLIEAFGKLNRRSICTVKDGFDIDLDREKQSLDDVIGFKFISARRDVTNKDTDKTLSGQTARIYRSLSVGSSREALVEDFKEKLRDADVVFSSTYDSIFADLIEKVRCFGGIKPGESNIKIASTLQHRDILAGNTTVMYEQETHELPEHYNGLGYMNLISMIFEIDILIKELQRARAGAGATLNLLFIEEPEAHTHPQMQYVFIKNIRQLLLEAGETLPFLQTVISTHSAHIVSEAEFDSIKYLQRTGQCVIAKNLRNLEAKYNEGDEDERRFRFLKQYLTLHRSELFFADKIVLIEGDTERILLPAMMRKIDQSGIPEKVVPLLSQNVSVVEVGAHSQVYEKLIDFLGLKTLIITDIDTGYTEEVEDGKETKPCCPNDPNAIFTSNHALCFYHGIQTENLDYLKKLTRENKCCAKQDDGSWKPQSGGNVFTAYQTEEDGYHGRSFEDAFFSLNKELLLLGHERFPSLTKKWYSSYVKGDIEPLEFANKAVNSKPSLAIEVLLNSVNGNSGESFTNWRTPAYIEEGLKWLRGDFDA
jgi:putative ATP-dependent endonuclease of the OLD family